MVKKNPIVDRSKLQKFFFLLPVPFSSISFFDTLTNPQLISQWVCTRLWPSGRTFRLSRCSFSVDSALPPPVGTYCVFSFPNRNSEQLRLLLSLRISSAVKNPEKVQSGNPARTVVGYSNWAEQALYYHLLSHTCFLSSILTASSLS
jgi:hypothetical protein